MVFSPVPLYLDPPNWQQQHLSGVNQGNENLHFIHPISVPTGPPTHMGGGGPGSSPQIRPNSMAERARIAKIPPPEAPLKCPRCDSTNTKFCYFNNYNLSQPRHFCKTCRRYWTRGGALRNVPVGGGCRRNKRSSSKTTSSGGGTPSSTSAKPSATGIGGGMDVGGPTGLVPGIGSGGMTSFMASLQNMAQLGMGNLGLTFGGALQAPPLGGGGDHHHHPQLDFNVSSLLNQHHHAPQMHFPGALSGAFELPPAAVQSDASGNPNLYSSTSSYQNDVVGNDSNLPKSTTSLSQLAPIKMEGERQVQGQGQGLNLDKQLMMGINNNSSSSTSIADNNNQFWGNGMVGNGTIGTSTNMWTDLSGLNSSSTSHLM